MEIEKKYNEIDPKMKNLYFNANVYDKKKKESIMDKNYDEINKSKNNYIEIMYEMTINT